MGALMQSIAAGTGTGAAPRGHSRPVGGRRTRSSPGKHFQNGHPLSGAAHGPWRRMCTRHESV